MEYDEDGLDDDPVRPLLPPDDRLWRHPSELGGVTARISASRRPSLVTLVTLTSSISVLLTLGTIAILRPLREHTVVQVRSATPSGAVNDVADVAALAERLRPAIAHIEATGPAGTTTGSAFLFRRDGMLITAHDIVVGAHSIQAIFDDGRSMAARLVGSDPETDVAVLDVDGTDFPVATFGSSIKLKVGQPAITIGSPASDPGGPLVTVGIVSALDQPVKREATHLVDMIQTDGPVASGCSGAAIVNQGGHVIAMAAMNQTTDAGVIGYATPIDVAREVATQLIAHGSVTKAWLGVQGRTVAVSRAKDLGVEGGAVVQTVSAGGPAASAGLIALALIVELDGHVVGSMAALAVLMRGHRPGDTVTLGLIRAGQRHAVQVTLVAPPPAS